MRFCSFTSVQFSSVAQSCPTLCNPMGCSTPRFLSRCPSPAPKACSNSCPSSWWCHPTISSSVCPLLLLPSIFPSIRVFSSESVLCIRWPKCWSFSICPSNEYSGQISFRINWFALFVVQGTQEFSPTLPFKSINSLALSFLYGLILTSILDY